MDVDDDVVDLSVGPSPTPSTCDKSNKTDSLSLTVGAVSIDPNVNDLRTLSHNVSVAIVPGAPQTAVLLSAVSTVSTSAAAEAITPTRRSLRPRTEPKSYAEAPDIVVLPPTKTNGGRSTLSNNGYSVDSASDDDMTGGCGGTPIPPMPMKELSAAEIWERERGLRKLREELRNEETKLVLLKKLKQSQALLKDTLPIAATVPVCSAASSAPNAPTAIVILPELSNSCVLSSAGTSALAASRGDVPHHSYHHHHLNQAHRDHSQHQQQHQLLQHHQHQHQSGPYHSHHDVGHGLEPTNLSSSAPTANVVPFSHQTSGAAAAAALVAKHGVGLSGIGSSLTVTPSNVQPMPAHSKSRYIPATIR